MKRKKEPLLFQWDARGTYFFPLGTLMARDEKEAMELARSKWGDQVKRVRPHRENQNTHIPRGGMGNKK
jgi:hypothetical protein